MSKTTSKLEDRAAAALADPVSRDLSWEKELAPKITRGQVVFAALLYAAWTCFLLYLAINRWFGGLQ